MSTPEFITPHHFLRYFKYPPHFWFLSLEEVEELFEDSESLEALREMMLQDQRLLIKQITESSHTLFSQNSFKLNALKVSKLEEAYIKFFSIPFLDLHNYSSIKYDSTEEIKRLLNSTQERNIFLYQPTLTVGGVRIKPTAIYKYEGRIYVIEHFWSTSLKRENISRFIFYNHFFKNLLHQPIDQYLITFLSKNPSPNKELLLEITNSLPFTSAQRVPEGPKDKKMKNVNTLFQLHIPYSYSLYEKFFSEDDYESINDDPWEIEYDPLINPQRIIDYLIQLKDKEPTHILPEPLIKRFLISKLNFIPPSSPEYKSLISHSHPLLKYSSNILPFYTTLKILNSLTEHSQWNDFLKYVSNLEFLPDFPPDQDYLVFPEALEHFAHLSSKRIKVYYDFETINLPFPYIENTKPYIQLVLQLSLIVTVDGKEVSTLNTIIDPLNLGVDSFRKIIDDIYRDEPGVAYIVYNKSFENTRLKEMAELIGEEEYRVKVMEIIDKTVDLANWFTYGNSPHIIHKKMLGFSSIKKVNQLIPPEIVEVTGVKNYSSLERCSNGFMAQALLLSRALVKDREADEPNWQRNKLFLEEYCENDVRSMIAVELYIKKLLDENKYKPADAEQFTETKLAFKRKPRDFFL